MLTVGTYLFWGFKQTQSAAPEHLDWRSLNFIMIINEQKQANIQQADKK